jgi:hypothetical protein
MQFDPFLHPVLESFMIQAVQHRLLQVGGYNFSLLPYHPGHGNGKVPHSRPHIEYNPAGSNIWFQDTVGVLQQLSENIIEREAQPRRTHAFRNGRRGCNSVLRITHYSMSPAAKTRIISVLSNTG